MIFKRIGSIGFAFAFILAIVVMTGYGSDIISRSTARMGIILFGAVALLMNLLSFRYDPQSEGNNLIFWMGSAIIFVGLVFKMQHYPYNQLILVIGLGVAGLSFFYNPFKKDSDQDDELLDQ
jgi:heme/copper-type cytochrome/quinol oxidase subunit 4